MNVLRRLIENVDAGTTCVLATVVQAKGSAPRRQGARLLLSASGTKDGTVGGGEVEAAVLDAAHGMLAGGLNAYTLEMPTNCGGTVMVMLERFGPHRRLVVVGAGHVGAALATAGARAGYQVTVASPTGVELRALAGVEIVAAAEPGMLTGFEHPGVTQVVVATGNADADSDWAVAALSCPFAGVGVVGSRTKAAAIRHAAAAAGVPPERVHTLRCPVGLDLGAVTPEEIAVSIVAELIRLDRTGEVPEGWRRVSRG
ncbi:MAG TPA: XdhC family protein [Thermoanaerobaculaceae bacterium]|nr:XdhC family protein [Thermoanaerobaculaceae bacterium]